MGLFFAAVLLANVALVFGSSTLGVVTALDPGRITSWRLQWPSLPVELSYTNAQEQGVVVMLRLNVPHSISQGIVEVVFPQGFDVSTAFCMETNCQKQPTIQGQTVILLGVTLEAGKDSMVTIGGITNPSAPGGYGPFGVRTRTCAGCQTLDINLAFASIGITGSVGTMKSVSLSTPAGVPTIRATGLTLDFSFVISKDLWRHDTVRITLSKYWTLENPACLSKVTTGRTNTFLSTSGDSAFGCSVTPKSTSPDGAQVLYIYGLGTDLDLSKSEDSKYVVLSVNGFTAPDYDYPDDFYSWRVETMRCTTRNVLEKGSIFSGPTVNPFPIQPATWQPTWSYPNGSLQKGMQLFMDLSFTLPYELPFNGYIQITTSGATVNSYWSGVNCYLKERYVGSDATKPWVTNVASCAGNGAYSILITGVPDLPMGKKFTVRSLVSIQATTGVKVTGITSYTADGFAINAGSDLATLAINTADPLLSLFEIVMTTAGGVSSESDTNWTGGNAGSYLKFRIQSSAGTLATSKFNITCPFASALDDFRMYVPNDADTIYEAKINADISVAADFTYSTTSLTRPDIKFVAAADPTTKLDYFELGPDSKLAISASRYLVIGISRNSGKPSFGWPKVANNAATAYECYITVTDTATKSTVSVQRGVAQFTIKPTEFTANAAYFCSKNYPGSPIYVQIQPTLFPISYSSAAAQYYVEFEFAETMMSTGSFYPRFASGLGDYSEYPYDLDDPVNSYQPGLEQQLSFQIYSENFRTKLRITNFETLRTDQSYALIFPIGEHLNKEIAPVTMRSYYTVTADDRVKNVQYEAVAALVASFTDSMTTKSDMEWVFGNYVLNGEVLAKNARLKLRILDTINLGQSTKWIYFILPQGYTLVNPSVKVGNWDIWSAVNSFVQPHYFVSPNPNFKFPSILVQCSGDACLSNAEARFVEIAGLKPSLGVPCSYKDLIRIVTTTNGDRSGQCLEAATIEHTTLAGDITLSEFQPQSIQARGPNSVDFSAKIVFRTQHGGYSDSIVILSVSPEFECISGVTSCTVEGLLNFNATTSVRCQLIGNEVVIDQFADFTGAPTGLITLQVHHLNPPMRNWDDSVHFIAAFMTRTRDGRTIDSWKVTNKDMIAVTPAEPQGHSSILKLETVPLNGGQKVADLHIAFSLPHEIPALAGRIDITSPVPLKYSAGNIQNQCWVSGLLYTSCTTDGSTVSFTFQQRYAPESPVEIYLDNALGSLSGGEYMKTAFAVTSYWGSAVVDRDFQPDPQMFVDVAQLSHRLKPLAEPSDEIASVAFSFDPTTAGEASWYTFTLQLASPLLPTDQLWVIFPQDAFDAYVGPADAIYSYAPDTFYIPCRSPDLGSVKCTADHWVVRLFPGNAFERHRDLTFSVLVFNPPHHLGYPLDLAHTSVEGEVKAILRGAAVVMPTAPASNIVVKNVTTSSVNLREDSECKFQIYLSQAMNTTNVIQVKFPDEFGLAIGAIPCNSTFLDLSPGATITTDQEWNPTSACNIDATNLVSFPAPSVSTAFDLSKLITLRVDALNPEWAYKRTGDLMWDFDKLNTVSQPSYDVWTDRWELFVYDTVTQAYTSRSYTNLHCGYSGLFTSKKQLIANSFNPELTTGRVKIGAGLSTGEIVIQVPGPLASKSLQLTARVAGDSYDRGFITCTSASDFLLYQTESQLTFNLAVDKQLMPGMYMLEWSAVEVMQPGISGPRYHPPVTTWVEVFAPNENSIAISLTHTDTVAVGVRSVPIRIQLASPPASQLIVNLAFSMEYRGVEIHPRMLVFETGQDVGYIELILDRDFDVESVDQIVLTFWLGGEDADLYQIPWVQAVDVTGAQSTSATPTVLTWSSNGCSRTSCSLSPQFSSPGIFYWQLAASGTPPLSLIQLRSKVDRLSDEVLIEDEDAGYDKNYLNDFRVASHTDPDFDETWESFQRRLYRSHLMTSYYGRAIQYRTSAELSFDWLWAETEYRLSGYFVDMFEAESEELGVALVTAPLADAASISLAFAAPPTTAGPIINALAGLLEVNPARLFYDSAAFSKKNSDLSISVVADRFVEGQDPAGKTLTVADLNAALSGNSLPSVLSLSYSALSSRKNLTLAEPLKISDLGLTWVELAYNASDAGELCCVALSLNTSLPTSRQAWIGLSAENEYLPRNCSAASVRENKLVMRGLLPGTSYQFICALGDSYPLWRTVGADRLVAAGGTKEQMPVLPQMEQFIPQAGGATIVTDVNSAAALKGLLVLVFLSLFAH